MSFDIDTRTKLQRFVGEARTLLTLEFTRQLQHIYGMDPVSGICSSFENLDHLDNDRRETALILRDMLDHYRSAMPNVSVFEVLDRIVREQAFTILNRLCALRMAESRGLLIESISKGYQSRGFQLYRRVAGSALGETGDAYKQYIFSLFDEISIDLSTLFDRFSPQGRLFPSEHTLLALLEAMNHLDIAPLWHEDETIGWIYQYFNSAEERKKMRAESTTPRNSRELAVRNQFFTPRYIVEWLTDNTLGRLWAEMTQGETQLLKECRYLMLSVDANGNLDGRPKAGRMKIKDPRDITLLDPACGSMHFGLYAFDLFERIYKEAWELEDRYGEEIISLGVNERTLRNEYGNDEASFLRDVPRLIMQNNIHGIDIDPRAVQIAALSLWLRAQRSWHEQGVKSDQRPNILKTNVVCAEPIPGGRESLQQFLNTVNVKPELHTLLIKIAELMKVAGEAGSLLKVEEEIETAIEHARRSSYSEQPTLFDYNEVQNHESFWNNAEQTLFDALRMYAEQTETHVLSSIRKRMFARDTAAGLSFIDVCRKQFDVVLMNPPFGDFSAGYKVKARLDYPNSYNDILAAFVERWLYKLVPGGRLGAITSRTCFYLTTFSNWREKIIMPSSKLTAFADLGQGVMDDAMVEAAAYVLQRSLPDQSETPFIRAIIDADRQEVLESCVAAVRNGCGDSRLFWQNQLSFGRLPDSPFVYWINQEQIRNFEGRPAFEPEVGVVRVGLQTGDDPRFVRTIWETPPENTVFLYFPANGATWCDLDDPIVQAYKRRQESGKPSWGYHVKAGASQPWFSPISLMVNWFNDGIEMRRFVDSKGKPRSALRSTAYYFRPGFSWTRRAVRLYPYLIPSGCIPSVSRYMAFPEQGKEYEALGVASSRLASAFMRLYAEFWQRPNFLVENLKKLPWPEMDKEALLHFSSAIPKAVEKRRQAYRNVEPFHEFTLPEIIHNFSQGEDLLSFDKACLLDEESEGYVAAGYALNAEEAASVEQDLLEAIHFQSRNKRTEGNGDTDSDSEDDEYTVDHSDRSRADGLISYVIGCIFGRWDIRMAMNPKLIPKMQGPFEPLPACPPGMLIGPEGLPAKPDGIVSTGWLRQRPSANTLPYEESLGWEIKEERYPLDVAWTGIISEDEEDPLNLSRRVRHVLDLIYGEETLKIERFLCKALGVSSLEDYLHKPNQWFTDHLRCYSKSRRQAPIYWPISTPSGSYTLWLYYHRLTDQTLYSCVLDYVDPKLKRTSEVVKMLRIKTNRNLSEERELETLTDLEKELLAFREDLLATAKIWKPDRNDGVVVTASPLWKFFRLRNWQKTLKDTWAKMEKGDFDWSKLAYSIWSRRVREKSKNDPSLAIAHQEALFQERDGVK